MKCNNTITTIIEIVPASTSLIAFFWSSSCFCRLAFCSFIWVSSSLLGISNWSCRATYIFCLPYSLNEIFPPSARLSKAFCIAVFFRLNFCNASATFCVFSGLFCYSNFKTKNHNSNSTNFHHRYTRNTKSTEATDIKIERKKKWKLLPRSRSSTRSLKLK